MKQLIFAVEYGNKANVLVKLIFPILNAKMKIVVEKQHLSHS